MGTLTLKQIRDLVIIDCGIEANTKFPPARVDKEINLAMRYVQIHLNGLGMKRWEVQQIVQLQNGTFVGQSVRYVDMNQYLTDLLEGPRSIKFLECHDINNTQHGLAFEVSDALFLEQITNTYTGPTITKPIFMRLANKIYIAPATVASAMANYYRAIPKLYGDNDVSQMPDEYEDLVRLRAEFQIKKTLGDLENPIAEEQKLDDAITEAYKKYSQSQGEIRRSNNTKNKLQ